MLCGEVLYKAEMLFCKWGFNKNFMLPGRKSDLIVKNVFDSLLFAYKVCCFVLFCFFSIAEK